MFTATYFFLFSNRDPKDGSETSIKTEVHWLFHSQRTCETGYSETPTKHKSLTNYRPSPYLSGPLLPPSLSPQHPMPRMPPLPHTPTPRPSFRMHKPATHIRRRRDLDLRRAGAREGRQLEQHVAGVRGEVARSRGTGGEVGDGEGDVHVWFSGAGCSFYVRRGGGRSLGVRGRVGLWLCGRLWAGVRVGG